MPAPPFRPTGQPNMGWLSTVFWFIVVLIGLPVVFWQLQQATGSTVATQLILLTVAIVIVVMTWLYRRGHLPSPGLRAWARHSDWHIVRGQGPWPWLVVDPYSRAVVRVALSGERHGLPVTVGEVWTRGKILGGVNESRRHTVIFVVVGLPHSYRTTAVEAYVGTGLSEAADEFDRWYHTTAEDLALAERLASPALRTAHVEGRIPPWRIVDDQLYAVSTLRAPLLPGKVLLAADQVLEIAELLGFTRYGPVRRPGRGHDCQPVADKAHADKAQRYNEIVARYFEMWNEGDPSIAPEVLSDDWVDHAHPEVTGPAGVQRAVEAVRASRLGLRFDVEAILGGAGDLVAVSGGVRQEDGPPARLMWLIRLRDGRMAEMWTYHER